MAKKESEPKTRGEKGTRETLCRTVRLRGLRPLMFDRYAGDNETQLTPEQKLYFLEDGRSLGFPRVNLMSFLSAQNTDSAPKVLLDQRKYKAFCRACRGFVVITPDVVPLTRNGEPIVFGGFRGEVDPTSGVYVDRRVARLDKGIPNPKVRPVVPLPWEMEFCLSLLKNGALQEQQLLNIFQEGGICVALGTNRPEFGAFEVVHWE